MSNNLKTRRANSFAINTNVIFRDQTGKEGRVRISKTKKGAEKSRFPSHSSHAQPLQSPSSEKYPAPNVTLTNEGEWPKFRHFSPALSHDFFPSLPIFLGFLGPNQTQSNAARILSARPSLFFYGAFLQNSWLIPRLSVVTFEAFEATRLFLFASCLFSSVAFSRWAEVYLFTLVVFLRTLEVTDQVKLQPCFLGLFAIWCNSVDGPKAWKA